MIPLDVILFHNEKHTDSRNHENMLLTRERGNLLIRERERPAWHKGKGKRRRIRFETHFHLTTTPRARTKETKRFPGYGGGLPEGDLTPRTSDHIISYHVISCNIVNKYTVDNTERIHSALRKTESSKRMSATRKTDPSKRMGRSNTPIRSADFVKS